MKHILFIKLGKFSHINDSVLHQLKEKFPEYKIDVFDVFDFFGTLRIRRFISLFYLIKEYGIDFINKEKSRYDYKTWEIVTSYGFKLIKKTIRKKVLSDRQKYIFTFQTQSMFDGSTQVIPHFLYTDSTVLANKWYPDISLKKVLKSKKWMGLEPSIYQNATKNFTFSTNQSRSIIEQYGVVDEKVKCIYAGSNLSTNSLLTSTNNYTNKNILFVGVNWERKGGDVLLAAFYELLKTIPDATLTIVGCTPPINHPNISVLGRLPITEVEQYYQNASVFCLPTKLEPFGIAFVEAMTRKLPIVSTQIGALPDMVTDNYNGFLHHYNDYIGISASLIILLNDAAKCKQFGEKSLLIVNERYNWNKVGSNFKKIIRNYI